MSITDVKKILEGIQKNPGSLKDGGDALDNVIRKLIGIEKKHLFQVETTSTQRRLAEVRALLDKELPTAMGIKDAS